jgi:hypothetical protein
MSRRLSVVCGQVLEQTTLERFDQHETGKGGAVLLDPLLHCFKQQGRRFAPITVFSTADLQAVAAASGRSLSSVTRFAEALLAEMAQTSYAYGGTNCAPCGLKETSWQGGLAWALNHGVSEACEARYDGTESSSQRLATRQQYRRDTLVRHSFLKDSMGHRLVIDTLDLDFETLTLDALLSVLQSHAGRLLHL